MMTTRINNVTSSQQPDQFDQNKIITIVHKLQQQQQDKS